jgi:hypothetical protein
MNPSAKMTTDTPSFDWLIGSKFTDQSTILQYSKAHLRLDFARKSIYNDLAYGSIYDKE